MTKRQMERVRRVLKDTDTVGDIALLCCAVRNLIDEREALLKAAKDLASIVMYNEISDEQIALGEAAEAAIAKAEAP